MTKNIVLENARILFPNFKGEPDRYNKQGRRSFCVLIPQHLADDLIKEGWNIKYLKPLDEGDDPEPYLNVGVRFDIMPPKIVMISGGRKMMLDESKIDILDWAELEKVDLTIRPYNWSVDDKGGVKAYLKTMYVTVYEDEFESQYRDIPEVE